MPEYKLTTNRCDCHRETCGCNPFLITKDGERYVTVYDHQKGIELVDALNSTADWISVDAQLPKPLKDVLVFIPELGVRVKRYDDEHKDWYHGDQSTRKVTHWQPLPQSPKETIK